jgi:quercetin dioxygenase-like cupin family protein
MRLFTLAEGGHTSEHRHPWWHVNYILEGEGMLYLDGIANPVRQGSVAYIESGKKHQFVNTGKSVFRFICVVPPKGDHY